MSYTEERTYQNGRTMRIVHDTGGVWGVSGDDKVHPHAGPGWSRDEARQLADTLAESQPSGDWVPSAAPGDTVPCVHAGCHGLMTFAVGPDPTQRGTSAGQGGESVHGTCDFGADDHSYNVRILT
jgi:hypothetical protein